MDCAVQAACRHWFVTKLPRTRGRWPSSRAATQEAVELQYMNEVRHDALDIVTGERLTHEAETPVQPSASRAGGILSELEAARRGADELQASYLQPGRKKR